MYQLVAFKMRGVKSLTDACTEIPQQWNIPEEQKNSAVPFWKCRRWTRLKNTIRKRPLAQLFLICKRYFLVSIGIVIIFLRKAGNFNQTHIVSLCLFCCRCGLYCFGDVCWDDAIICFLALNKMSRTHLMSLWLEILAAYFWKPYLSQFFITWYCVPR